MGGEPKDKILDIFFRAARGMLTPEQFEPDLSVLPSGVYPGQKMYFVHVENLGLGKSQDLWRWPWLLFIDHKFNLSNFNPSASFNLHKI